LTNHVASTSTWKLTANSKSVTTTVANSASIADILNALYNKVGSSHSDVFTSALFTVTTATGKFQFETLRKGSPSPTAFTYKLEAFEDAATTTDVTNDVISATVNALEADDNQVWVQLAATVSDSDGVKATSTSATGANFTMTSLTASGTNVGDKATGDDNVNIQAASADEEQTAGNKATIKANSVDNTAEIK